MAQDWTDDIFAPGHVGQTDLQNMENNFGCLKSCFSGGSGPSDPVPGMFWYDTGNHILKLRNEANNDWLSVWDLANGKAPAGSIVEACIVALAVTEGKLAAGAVTEPKLGTGAVTSTKLGSGAVSEAKLASAVKPWILLSDQDASNSATIDFTSVITSSYDEYMILLTGIVPVSNGVTLRLRYSTDNGSSWKAGGNDYRSGAIYYDHIPLIATISNTAALGGVSGEVRLIDPGSTTHYVKTRAILQQWVGGANEETLIKSGISTAVYAVNAIRFYMSSGNITSGNFRLYGLRN